MKKTFGVLAWITLAALILAGLPVMATQDDAAPEKPAVETADSEPSPDTARATSIFLTADDLAGMEPDAAMQEDFDKVVEGFWEVNVASSCPGNKCADDSDCDSKCGAGMGNCENFGRPCGFCFCCE